MTEIGRRAESGPHADDRLFTSHLIDLVTALLLAPLSPQTLAWPPSGTASHPYHPYHS